MNDYELVNYQIERNNIYDVSIRKLEYCEQCEQYEWILTILIIEEFMSRLGRHELNK